MTKTVKLYPVKTAVLTNANDGSDVSTLCSYIKTMSNMISEIGELSKMGDEIIRVNDKIKKILGLEQEKVIGIIHGVDMETGFDVVLVHQFNYERKGDQVLKMFLDDEKRPYILVDAKDFEKQAYLKNLVIPQASDSE